MCQLINKKIQMLAACMLSLCFACEAVDVGAISGTTTVECEYGSGYYVCGASTTCSWLHIKGYGTKTVTFTWDDYNAYSGSRTGTITFSTRHTELRNGSYQWVYNHANSFTVTQKAGRWTMSCSTTSFDRFEGDGAVSVSTSIASWSIVSSVSWITLDATSGSGSKTVSFRVAPNETTETRTGTISIGGKSVTITQAGITDTVVACDTIAFESRGGDGTINVSIYAAPWSLSTDSSWITLSTNTGGSNDVPFRVHANAGASSRTAKITASESTFTITQEGEPATERAYCIIDISGGPSAESYPLTYLSSVPSGGWSDEYKSSKIVLRRIPKGAFISGKKADWWPGSTDAASGHHTITLPLDYYIGVFEITQRQWELVMGTNPSYFTNLAHKATRPVERVSYDMIRGNNQGAKWPNSRSVDNESFVGILRKKTGFKGFDLPTCAQWEYACRAGTDTSLNTGVNMLSDAECPNMNKAGRYGYNSGYITDSTSNRNYDTTRGTAAVGSYLPNSQGIYDMHGNVMEWCLDWHSSSSLTNDAVNPQGAVSGSERFLRGGSYVQEARFCCPTAYGSAQPNAIGVNAGFRIAAILDDCEVTCNSNDGSSSATVVDVRYGDSIGSFPEPIRKHYKVSGWYTAPEGGVQIHTNTVITEDIELYAHWVCDHEDSYARTITLAVPATCTDSGMTAELLCLNCGEIIPPVKTNPLGHLLRYYSKSPIAPTCTQAGSSGEISCYRCNEVISPPSEIPPLGHVEGRSAITLAPSATSTGERTFYCARCNEVVRTETIPALGEQKADGTYTDTIDGVEWTYVITDGKATIGDGNAAAIATTTAGDIVVPSVLGGCYVTAIANKAFYGCTKIIGVTLQEGVVSAGDYAFASCSSLANLVFPASFTTFGNNVFYRCAKIANVIFNGNAPTGTDVFYYSRSVCQVKVKPTSTGWGDIPGTWNYGATSYIECNHTRTIITEAEVATCTKVGNTGKVICIDCGQVVSEGEIPLVDVHNFTVTIEAIEPTCLTEGRSREVKCSDCGRTFENSAILPALGHNPVESKAAIPATCIETGMTREMTCSHCKEVVETATVVEALGHNIGPWVDLGSISSTKGRKVRYCLRCWQEMESEEYDIEQPKSNGTYTETVNGITWTYVIKDGKAQVGTGGWGSNAIPKDTAGEVVVPSILGGCPVTSIAESAFTACSSMTTLIISDDVVSIGDWAIRECSSLTKIILGKSIASLGYACLYQTSNVKAVYCRGNAFSSENLFFYSEEATLYVSSESSGWTVTIPGDWQWGSIAYWDCKHESTCVKSGVLPTCTMDGCSDAEICNECRAIVSGGEVLPALGHQDVVATDVVNPTCAAVGKTAEHRCARCGVVTVPISDIPKVPHTLYESRPAIAPTCTTIGKTAEISCSVCSNIIEAVKGVPMIAHTEKILTPQIDPTCTEIGYNRVSECAVCGKSLSTATVIPAKGHTEEVIVQPVAATCTAMGRTKGAKCSDCGIVLSASSESEPLGHIEGAPVVTAAPTETETGELSYPCERCGEIVRTETLPCVSGGNEDSVWHSSTNTWVYENPLDTFRKQITPENRVLTESAWPDGGPYTETVESGTDAGEITWSFMIVDGKAIITSGTAGVPCVDAWIIGGDVPIEVPAVLGGRTVAEIGDSAFYGCLDFGSLMIPSTVTKIGDNAFNGFSDGWGGNLIFKGDAPALSGQALNGFSGVLFLWAPCDAEGWNPNGDGTWNDNIMSYFHYSCRDIGESGAINFSDHPCVKCGVVQDAVEKMLIQVDHEKTITKEAVKATCVSKGCTEGWRCNHCGKTQTSSTIAATSHRKSVLAEKIEPTCTTDGYAESAVCLDCGEILSNGELIQRLGHEEYVSKAASAATCTADGNSEERSCSRCNAVLVPAEIYPALGHSSRLLDLVLPTEDLPGYIDKVICDRCDVVLREPKPTYYVSFDANGGEGEMTNLFYIAGSEITLDANKYLRNGYVFEGWSGVADGDIVYEDSDVITNVPSFAVGGYIPLFARWRGNNYIVRFDANGGEGVMDAVQMSYGLSQELPGNLFVRTGYSFDGWAETADGPVLYSDVCEILKIDIIPDNEQVLFARWRVNKYTLTFDANGGTGGSVADVDFSSSITAPTVSRTGYTFKGWNPVLSETMPASNVTYTAQWEANEYKVVFNANGGEGGMLSIDAIYGVPFTLPENAFVRDRCSFLGWSQSDSGRVSLYDGVMVSNLTTTAGRVVELYAKWRADNYTIQFDANGGEGSMGSFVFTFGDFTPLPVNEFSKPGYVFEGWATNSASDVVYSNGTAVRDLASERNGVVTLYAKWAQRGVRDVSARQRFPWNGKVDIDFEIVGDLTAGLQPMSYAEISISASNILSGVSHIAKADYLSGDIGIDEGHHRVVWDMDAQGLEFRSDEVVITVAYKERSYPYCVIDLSGGPNAVSYPVTSLMGIPNGGWTDEYKTAKLVLRRINAGKFTMGHSNEYDSLFPNPPRSVTIYEPYCIGVFEVTQKQYELVTGVQPSSFSGETRPVERVSWNEVRGNAITNNWPDIRSVDMNSFIGLLRQKTGINFDLPSEQQWECACRAGTKTVYSYGDVADGSYMWYFDNASSSTHEVGLKLPNPWGFYDIHGNVSELCLDASGSFRFERGGSWRTVDWGCASSRRDARLPYGLDSSVGFRVARTMPYSSRTRATWSNDSAPAVNEVLGNICFGISPQIVVDQTDSPLFFSNDLIRYDSSWIGEDENAIVVVTDNGSEIFRTTGTGGFAWNPRTDGKHILTYSTYIDGIAQNEVYEATVYSGWRYDIKNGKAVITDTTYTEGDVTIPSQIDGVLVDAIADGLFAYCSNITSIVISEGVTEIGENAFLNCSSLTNVVIPISVVGVGVSAFEGCQNIESLTVPVGLVDKIPLMGLSDNVEIKYALIKNVVAKQRYPWNGKVDISYEVVGDITTILPNGESPVLTVIAKDIGHATNYTAVADALSCDAGFEEGIHHVVWDLNAQGLEFKSDDVVFSVSYELEDVELLPIVADHLIGAYFFDGNLEDATTNKYSLSGNEGIFTADRNDISENAYSFDGQSKYVQSLNCYAENEFSFAFWAKTSVTMNTSGSGSGGSLYGGNYVLFPSHGGDNAGIGVKIGTDGICVRAHGSGYIKDQVKYTGTVDTGWNHIAVTVSSNGNICIYLNGLCVKTGAKETTRKLVFKPTVGGASYGYYTGLIDDLFVFDKTLDANAVASIADEGLHRPEFRSRTNVHLPGESDGISVDSRLGIINRRSDAVLWNSTWVGGRDDASVVIADNGVEVECGAGNGEYELSPGRHDLVYTTYIDGDLQDEVYCATVYRCACPVSNGDVALEEVNAAQAATCTADGWTHEVICNRCNEILEPSVVLPKFGHDECVTKEAQSATCTVDGWTREVTCNRCGEILEASMVLPKLGHDANVTKESQAATCTADGWTHEVTCNRCNEILETSVVLPKLGHEERVTKEAQAATCTADGWTQEVTCNRCNEVLEPSVVLPKLGHASYVTKEAQAATCTADGWTREVICTRCNVVLETSKPLARLGHIKSTTISAIEPTCTTDGRTAEITCTRCNAILQTSEVLASLGHSGAITKHAVAPTSSTAGSTAEITCTRCGTVLQDVETIPALGYIRNVQVAQLWPHRKIAMRYEIADDIYDVVAEGSTVVVKGTYGSTTKTAKKLIGDTSCTPGVHNIVWDVESDSITHSQSSMSFTITYSSQSANASCLVDLRSAIKNGMSIDGTKKNLWNSPFADGEVQLLIDGKVFLSSTNLNVFAWIPQVAGEHTLVHKSGDYSWVRTLTVHSLAYNTPTLPNPPTAEDSNIVLKSTVRSFAQTGGSGLIETSGSGTWSATVSDDWIIIRLEERNAGLPVAYSIAENNNAETRTGYIYVSGHVFTVTQSGLGGELDSYSADFETDGGTGSFNVVVDTETSWAARSNVDWISIDPVSGTGEGEITFMVAPWNEVSTRVGTITAAGKTFSVNQVGRRMKLSTNKVEENYESHVLDVQINALFSTEWDIEIGASWISVVDEGRGKGSGNVYIAVAENPSFTARTGVVRIGTETLTITQSGRPTAALSFIVSPPEATASVEGANGLISVAATPDLPWTAKSGANWLTIMPSFLSGEGNGNVIYTASPNPNMSARTGRITVTPVSGSGLSAAVHAVTQPAASASVSSVAHTFDPAGSSYDVEVTVDDIVNWTVSSSANWVNVDTTTTRIGPGTVTIAVTENLTTLSRTATVTIAGHVFTVTQPGRSIEVGYEAKVFGTESVSEDLDVHPDGEVTWTAIVSADALSWLTVWGDNCSYDDDGNLVGTGEQTLECIVSDYVGDGTPRTGTITIGDKVIYITQRAYELSISPSAIWVDGNGGIGSVSVSASVDGVWNAFTSDFWITPLNTNGIGSGTIEYRFTDNNTGQERKGKIIISGEEYTITQAARQMVAIDASANNAGGTVSGGGTYVLGTTVTLTAAPNDGYTFEGWIVAGSDAGNANPLTLRADVNKEVIANFKRIPVYLVNGDAVREGTSKTFTAPDAVVDEAGTTKIVCKGTSTYPDKGTSFTLVVTEDISFEWDLWETNYLVTVEQTAGGTVALGGLQSSTAWIASGTEITLTATPVAGNSLFRWNVTHNPDNPVNPVQNNSASLRLCVENPVTVSAEFGVFNDSLADSLDAPELVFKTGGDSDWTASIDATAQTGYTSARSGAIGPESETWMEMTLLGSGTLSFRWKVDCEQDDGGGATWDRLAVFTNNVEAARIDGNSGWRAVTLPVSGEKTTVRWSFYRDDYDAPDQRHENAAWVDGVNWDN